MQISELPGTTGTPRILAKKRVRGICWVLCAHSVGICAYMAWFTVGALWPRYHCLATCVLAALGLGLPLLLASLTLEVELDGVDRESQTLTVTVTWVFGVLRQRSFPGVSQARIYEDTRSSLENQIAYRLVVWGSGPPPTALRNDMPLAFFFRMAESDFLRIARAIDDRDMPILTRM